MYEMFAGYSNVIRQFMEVATECFFATWHHPSVHGEGEVGVGWAFARLKEATGMEMALFVGFLMLPEDEAQHIPPAALADTVMFLNQQRTLSSMVHSAAPPGLLQRIKQSGIFDPPIGMTPSQLSKPAQRRKVRFRHQAYNYEQYIIPTSYIGAPRLVADLCS